MSGRRGTRLLILGADLGSNGQDGSDAQGWRRNTPEDDSRGGAVPDFTELGAPGSIRAAVWPGSFSTARVIHPWPHLGSGRAATALAAVAVGQRGEARW